MSRSRISQVRAAIDLASIMVGVIVIGLISGALAATVFAVIPWTQDQAAAQQLKEVVSAQAGFRGLNTTHTNGSYQDLAQGSMLNDNIEGLCVTPTASGAGYTAVIKSATTKVFTMTDKDPSPAPGTAADFTACATNTGAIGTDQAAVAAAASEPAILRFTVNTALKSQGTTGTSCKDFTIPVQGTVSTTVDWGDGTAAQPVTTQFKTHTFPAGGSAYTVTVDGTFTDYGAYDAGYTPTGGTGCITSINHWGKDTGTTATRGAYAFFTGVTGVVQPPASVKTFDWMFRRADYFNQPVGSWDTSHVTSLSGVFWGASSFNQPLDGWDTSQVKDLSAAFEDAAAFNQPLNNWKVGNVTTLSYTFQRTDNFNQPLDKWDTGKVTSLEGTFNQATVFNSDISTWNTASVISMSSTFGHADVFNQPIGSWNVSSVKDMQSTFSAAYKFNQPIAGWDTSKVISMREMFYAASKFNQNISGWNVAAVIAHDNFSFAAGSLTPAFNPVFPS